VCHPALSYDLKVQNNFKLNNYTPVCTCVITEYGLDLFKATFKPLCKNKIVKLETNLSPVCPSIQTHNFNSNDSESLNQLSQGGVYILFILPSNILYSDTQGTISYHMP
jgi:hypothetical protein